MDIQKEIETLIGCAGDNSINGEFEANDRAEENHIRKSDKVEKNKGNDETKQSQNE